MQNPPFTPPLPPSPTSPPPVSPRPSAPPTPASPGVAAPAAPPQPPLPHSASPAELAAAEVQVGISTAAWSGILGLAQQIPPLGSNEVRLLVPPQPLDGLQAAAAVRQGSSPLQVVNLGLSNQSVAVQLTSEASILAALFTPDSPPHDVRRAELVSSVLAIAALSQQTPPAARARQRLLQDSFDGRNDDGGALHLRKLSQEPLVQFSYVESTESGGGNCSSTASLFESDDDTAECVAGCCTDGRCVCRQGYSGPRCELVLRCGRAATLSSNFSTTSCQTTGDALGGVTCACEGLGFFGVLSMRLAPATTALLRPDTLDNLWRFQKGSGAWIAGLVLYAFAMAFAFISDQATMYTTSLPDWLMPQQETVLSQLKLNLRIRTTLIRCVHVYPDHTRFTRAQLFHCLAMRRAARRLEPSEPLYPTVDPSGRKDVVSA